MPRKFKEAQQINKLKVIEAAESRRDYEEKSVIRILL